MEKSRSKVIEKIAEMLKLLQPLKSRIQWRKYKKHLKKRIETMEECINEITKMKDEEFKEFLKKVNLPEML